MCGRYALILPPEAIRQLFQFLNPVWAQGIPNWAARYNVAPTQSVPVLCAGGTLAIMRWGLVPHWAKDIASAPLINARGESLRDKPSFRDAFSARRCLVPANGFYEWREEAGQKIPMYIRLRSKAPIVFGGIWEKWRRPDGSDLDSMAIITTLANAHIGQLHDRMPLILGAQDWKAWLDLPPGDAQGLVRPCPDDWLEYFTVSQRVNSVANDGPDLIAPEDTASSGTPPPRRQTSKKKIRPDGGQGTLF